MRKIIKSPFKMAFYTEKQIRTSIHCGQKLPKSEGSGERLFKEVKIKKNAVVKIYTKQKYFQNEG